MARLVIQPFQTVAKGKGI